jgi:hypothetical protein
LKINNLSNIILLQNYKLIFDIEYIIVKEEAEIKEIIRHIEDTAGSKYTHESIEKLKCRFLTYAQIVNDF